MNPHDAETIYHLRDENKRLRAAVAIHRVTTTETQDDRWECCASCGADWPCPTAEVAGTA